MKKQFLLKKRLASLKKAKGYSVSPETHHLVDKYLIPILTFGSKHSKLSKESLEVFSWLVESGDHLNNTMIALDKKLVSLILQILEFQKQRPTDSKIINTQEFKDVDLFLSLNETTMKTILEIIRKEYHKKLFFSIKTFSHFNVLNDSDKMLYNFSDFVEAYNKQLKPQLKNLKVYAEKLNIALQKENAKLQATKDDSSFAGWFRKKFFKNGSAQIIQQIDEIIHALDSYGLDGLEGNILYNSITFLKCYASACSNFDKLMTLNFSPKDVDLKDTLQNYSKFFSYSKNYIMDLTTTVSDPSFLLDISSEIGELVKELDTMIDY